MVILKKTLIEFVWNLLLAAEDVNYLCDFLICKITVKLQKIRERLAHGVVEMAHFLNYDALSPLSLHSKIVKSLSSVAFFFGGFKMMHCFAGN